MLIIGTGFIVSSSRGFMKDEILGNSNQMFWTKMDRKSKWTRQDKRTFGISPCNSDGFRGAGGSAGEARRITVASSSVFQCVLHQTGHLCEFDITKV
jgi:hypothetical protein